MRTRGLEPPSLTAQPPQNCVSTISPRPHKSAQERSRTSTPLRALVPETSASAIPPPGQKQETDDLELKITLLYNLFLFYVLGLKFNVAL